MKKILLADSIIAFHDRNKNFLNRSGLRILTAATGRDALRVHQQEEADLIIADLNTPDLQGDELCALIRTEKGLKNVPVILVCGDTPEHRARVELCGADAWVANPINPEKLMDTIGRFITVSSRTGYRVLLKAHLRDKPEIAPFFCTSHDISSTGMMFESDRLLDNGDRVTCTFFLTGACRITTEGDVVRSVKTADDCFRYGIRFIDLAPEYRTEIEKFVSRFPRKA